MARRITDRGSPPGQKTRVNPSGQTEITYTQPDTKTGRPAGRRKSRMFPGTVDVPLGWAELQPILGAKAPAGRVYVVSQGWTKRSLCEHLKIVPAECKDEITEVVWVEPDGKGGK